MMVSLGWENRRWKLTTEVMLSCIPFQKLNPQVCYLWKAVMLSTALSLSAPFFVLSVNTAQAPSLDYRTKCSPTQKCAPFTFIIAN